MFLKGLFISGLFIMRPNLWNFFFFLQNILDGLSYSKLNITNKSRSIEVARRPRRPPRSKKTARSALIGISINMEVYIEAWGLLTPWRSADDLGGRRGRLYGLIWDLLGSKKFVWGPYLILTEDHKSRSFEVGRRPRKRPSLQKRSRNGLTRSWALWKVA